MHRPAVDFVFQERMEMTTIKRWVMKTLPNYVSRIKAEVSEFLHGIADHVGTHHDNELLYVPPYTQGLGLPGQRLLHRITKRSAFLY